MNTTAAAEALTAARAAKASAFARYIAASKRTAKALGLAFDEAEDAVKFAIRDYEMAVRAENAGLAEAEIQMLVRAA